MMVGKTRVAAVVVWSRATLGYCRKPENMILWVYGGHLKWTT